jgi:uncharacterized membrane-anchored protein
MEQCEQHNDFCKLMGEIGANINNLTMSINTLNARIDGSFEAIAEHIRESHVYREKIIQTETVLRDYIKHQEEKEKQAMWRIGIVVTIINLLFAAVIQGVQIFFRR